MARRGITIQQVTSLHRVVTDVFPDTAPGAFVVSWMPSKASDERLLRYVQAAMSSEDLAIRKRAMADYLLVTLHSWNLVKPAPGDPTSIIEVPCPLCDTKGKVEIAPEHTEEHEVLVTTPEGATITTHEAHIIEAIYEECPYCYGAGVVPQDPEPLAIPELPSGEVEMSYAEAKILDASEVETEDAIAELIEQQPVDDSEDEDAPDTPALNNLFGDTMVVPHIDLVEGEPLPITRENLYNLGVYYMAAIMGAMQRRVLVGKSRGSISTTG